MAVPEKHTAMIILRGRFRPNRDTFFHAHQGDFHTKAPRLIIDNNLSILFVWGSKCKSTGVEFDGELALENFCLVLSPIYRFYNVEADWLVKLQGEDIA